MKTRSWIRLVAWIGFTTFVSCGSATGCADGDSDFRGHPSLTADDGQLRSTYISPHLRTPIATGTNVLWCGTFQLAWNECCSSLGGDLQVATPNPMVDALNKHDVTSADLDADSYVAVAGRVRDGVIDRIHQQMAAKFNGRAHPKIDGTLSPQDILAYSFLFKKFDFPAPFEKLDAPLDFRAVKVDAFGMDSSHPGHEDMAKNVLISDYKTRDDFVIELKTKSKSDHLVLAKVTPAVTLADTIESVMKRRDSVPAIQASENDPLSVPKLFFDITRSYHEIIGQPVTAPPAVAADNSRILTATQDITFELDEKGVVLRSESEMSIGCSANYVPAGPPPPHVMIFDKPYLLMLIREGSHEPYFAVWVDNAELLEKAAK